MGQRRVHGDCCQAVIWAGFLSRSSACREKTLQTTGPRVMKNRADKKK